MAKGKVRMTKISGKSFQFIIDGTIHRISLVSQSGLYRIQLGRRQFEAQARPISANCLSLSIAGRSVTVYLAEEQGIKYVSVGGRQFLVEEARGMPQSQISPQAQAVQTGSAIVSPMPGQVVKIQVSQGDVVHKNQTLAIVEAMKMENELKSTGPARVKKICAAAGDLVDAGQVIVELELEE
jgi:biotin carboxyl carrier protein